MMMKNIKDYLHFYLGCECKFGVIVPGQKITFYGQLIDTRVIHNVLNNLAEVKPILRPLSDMTKEEDKEFQATKVFQTATPVHIVGSMHWTAETFRWSLSKSFDLFNLIPEGLAIDKTKMTETIIK